MDGPGRIIGRDGRAAVWIVHGGVPLVAPENALRPASSSEIYAKQILELRPSRKRMREVMRDNPTEEHIPFAEDYQLRSWPDDGEAQPNFVEIPQVSGPSPVDAEEYEPSLPPEAEAPAGEPEAPVPGLPQVQEQMEEVMEQVPAPQSEEPEGEIIPDTPTQQPVQPAETQLQQAMRRSLDQLDGHPAPPPGLGARQRSRSPLREARNVRIPEDNAMMS